MATFRALIGPAGWDAVEYVREQLGDTDPNSFTVPDSAFQSFVTATLADFSRFVPAEALIGDIYHNTSGLQTVQAQHRYLLTVANGAVYPVMDVTDVLYAASGGYSAATEIGYMALLPFSPANAFLFTPSLVDSPTERVLRDSYLNEIDHYGKGKWATGLDPSGNKFIDIFPVPNTAGLPIFVRYTTPQIATAVPGDPTSSVQVKTIPDEKAEAFGDLLFARTLLGRAIQLSQESSVTNDMVKVQGSPKDLRELAFQTREEVYLRLGMSAGVAEVGS